MARTDPDDLWVVGIRLLPNGEECAEGQIFGTPGGYVRAPYKVGAWDDYAVVRTKDRAEELVYVLWDNISEFWYGKISLDVYPMSSDIYTYQGVINGFYPEGIINITPAALVIDVDHLAEYLQEHIYYIYNINN
jgi:hypothetical protein